MGKLTGEEVRTLAKMLSQTLSQVDLESFVYASTGDQLYDEFVEKNLPKRPMIEKLLIALEQLDVTSNFLAYVYVNRPGNQEIRAEILAHFPEAVAPFDKKINLSAQTAGAPQANASNNAVAPGLQRNVRPYIKQLDVRIWQEKLLRIERQVCLVEIAGTPLGTGFLVGPDAVLTNWHVFEAAKNADKLDKLGCRFDFVRLPNNTTQPGQVIAVDLGVKPDVSPYSDAEKTATPENPPPTPEQLDYCLLRLSKRVGEEQIEGAARGWISLPKQGQPLAADAPILIVQHPKGEPMKLALDTQAVIGVNANGTRVRYRTNTEAGSSGSPVFTMEWDLVALHHLGDPDWHNPAFNQGVPIELIRQRIEQDGFGAALGA
jgi:V8-like Glu-specific endopeptidase